MPRWALWIDIEGFSSLYRDAARALRVFVTLLDGVYRIGSRGFPSGAQRLFAHHVGDGFVVVSDIGDPHLERPVCIAIALLRHVASTGWFCKDAIGEGELADIRGCYPAEIRSAENGSGRFSMGDGLLTTLPVMGSALINAYDVSRKAKGALLLVSSSEGRRLPRCQFGEPEGSGVLAIDWVHSELDGVSELQQRAGLEVPTQSALENGISGYCSAQYAGEEWCASTKRFLGLAHESPGA
jgi:hypothetical protein